MEASGRVDMEASGRVSLQSPDNLFKQAMRTTIALGETCPYVISKSASFLFVLHVQQLHQQLMCFCRVIEAQLLARFSSQVL